MISTGTAYRDYYQLGFPDREARLDILYPKFWQYDQTSKYFGKWFGLIHRVIDWSHMKEFVLDNAIMDFLINPVTGEEPDRIEVGQYAADTWIAYDADDHRILVDPDTLEVKMYTHDDFINSWLENQPVIEFKRKT